jgi:hypothetical protein
MSNQDTKLIPSTNTSTDLSSTQEPKKRSKQNNVIKAMPLAARSRFKISIYIYSIAHKLNGQICSSPQCHRALCRSGRPNGRKGNIKNFHQKQQTTLYGFMVWLS